MIPLETLNKECGLNINRYEPVHGGDINECWRVYANDRSYFIKINNADQYPLMFEKEARGLQALSNNCSITIPGVIKQGIAEGQQYLLLEWIEKGLSQADCQEKFGAALALLHQKEQPFFGWKEDNYIGSLPQPNTQRADWPSFYRECRIMPLVQQLFNTGSFSKNDIALAEKFCGQLDQLFPYEPSSLLHGDLWSGNYMISSSGYVVLYDPAVYCGHREMDIGMSKLFGGFDEKFYRVYTEIYPLENGWQQRLSWAQLYPLLVHAVLFGGHYISSARGIIKQF